MIKNFLSKINLFNCKTLPRKVFTFYFTFLLVGTLLLLLPISRAKGEEPISLINAIFTAASAFSNTGLIVVNTGTYFSLFGQIVILILIQIGGLGLMTLKVLLFLFLGMKIGIKERIFAATERGDGRIRGTVDLLKSALIAIFSTELIATILFSIRYYTNYYDAFNNSFLNVVFNGLFTAVSSTCNAGFDILGGNSIEMFANDYFIQILTIICFVIGGLGFPIFHEIKEYIHCKKSNEKFTMSFLAKVILKGYFIVTIASLIIVFAIELQSGSILYNTSAPLMQRISYVVFNTLSTRSAGFATIDINEFATGSKTIFSLLMWIGTAPASTGGGVRVTTLLVCIYTLTSYIKNKNCTVIKTRRIPQSTVVKSFLVLFLSQILLLVTSIIITSAINSSFLAAYFEACSAFGTTGLSLGITKSLNIISKVSIIILMFAGQIGVSNIISMWTNNKTATNYQTLPEENILIN